MKEKIFEIKDLFVNNPILFFTHAAFAAIICIFIFTAIIQPKNVKIDVKETCQKEIISFEKALYAFEMNLIDRKKDVSLSYSKMYCNDIYKQYGEKLEQRYEKSYAIRQAQNDKALKLQAEIDAFAKVEKQIGNLVTMEIIKSCK